MPIDFILDKPEIKTTGIDFITDDKIDFIPDKPELFLDEETPIGFLEAAGEDIVGKLPFSPIGILENIDVLTSAKRLEKNVYEKPPIFHPAGDIGVARKYGAWAIDPRLSEAPEWTPESQRQQDLQIVADWANKMQEHQRRGYTFGGRVGQLVSEMPAFMIEFLVTGGIAKTGEKATTKIVEKFLKKSAEKVLVN